MSAELVHAFQAEAHRLDAEADNLTEQTGENERDPTSAVNRILAQTLRNLAQRAQGTDPAQAAADEAAASEGAAGGLSVEKTGEASQ